MKFVQYLIAIIILLTVLAWVTGWFDDLNKQSEIDNVMKSVKNAATSAVDAVAESAANALDAVDGMASDATIGAGDKISRAIGGVEDVTEAVDSTVGGATEGLVREEPIRQAQNKL
jgi:hypothetical protein